VVMAAAAMTDEVGRVASIEVVGARGTSDVDCVDHLRVDASVISPSGGRIEQPSKQGGVCAAGLWSFICSCSLSTRHSQGGVCRVTIRGNVCLVSRGAVASRLTR
jgi:hypothetical protein